MAILEVQHIQKSFGSTDVLKDISFSLEKGQVLSIIGSSGSGKTTLLRCLNFLETAEKGKIIVNGQTLFCGEEQKRVSEEAIRKNRLHFGLVFQSFNLFPQYTVLENVMLAPKLLKKAPIAEIEQTARALIEQVGLSASSGWPLPGRWRWSRTFSALTSRPLPWIRNSPARFCGSSRG